MLAKVIIFGAISLSFVTCQTGNDMGPLGTFDFYYIKKCENYPTDENIKLDLELDTTSEEKKMNAHLILPYAIDRDNYRLKLRVDKWSNGDYKENYFTTEGPLYETIEKYVNKVFENLKQGMNPPVLGDYVDAGEYSVSSYTESSSNLDFPQVFYGKVKLFAYVERIEDGNSIFCFEAEGESIPPS